LSGQDSNFIKDNKIYKAGIQLLKFAVFGVACFIIYRTLNTQDFQHSLARVYKGLFTFKGGLLLLSVFLLQFVNYSLEAIKWQRLVRLQYKIPLIRLIKAVYVGNSLSIFTPNRVGSYIGRMYYLQEYPKLFIAATSFIGNLAQLTATVFFGMIGFMFFTQEPFFTHNVWFLLFFSILLIVFLLVLFFGKLTMRWFNRFDWYLTNKSGLDFMLSLHPSKLVEVLSVATVRYLIFVVEFWLVLLACGVDLTLWEALVYCGVIYAVSNFIPSPMMGNLGTRELVVMLVFSLWHQETNAVAASLIIWVINVAFPSVLGGVLLNLHPHKSIKE
jgi:uncharacterized membrane protein YbhN (UPF0104 family)